MKGRYVWNGQEQLEGTVDAAARFERFPHDYTIKGMFFTGIVGILGPGRALADPRLVAPPRGGRYLPFSDYPQVDYSRLAHSAALHKWPELPPREALRRLARQDIDGFARSRVGRVSLSFAGNASSVLERLPKLYDMSLRGGHVSSSTHPDGAVTVSYRDFYGWVDCYPLGTLEGIVRHFGQEPDIEMEILGPADADFTVRWR